MAVGISRDAFGQAGRNIVVDQTIDLEAVAGFGQIDFRRQPHERGRRRTPLVTRTQHQCSREVAARRGVPPTVTSRGL
jgi:hypothetical protein